jgi:hypothetical protein
MRKEYYEKGSDAPHRTIEKGTKEFEKIKKQSR